HLALDLELDFKTKSVTGCARLRIKRQSSLDHVLVLDAVAFEISKIVLHVGKKPVSAEFHYDDRQIEIQVPVDVQIAEVEIHYRAVPRRGLYFLAPDAKVTTRPVQVWSQCQDEDARHWFPCQDKP